MIVLSLHLYHGLWSMFQSLGVSHPRYTPLLKRLVRGLRDSHRGRLYFHSGGGA